MRPYFLAYGYPTATMLLLAFIWEITYIGSLVASIVAIFKHCRGKSCRTAAKVSAYFGVIPIVMVVLPVFGEIAGELFREPAYYGVVAVICAPVVSSLRLLRIHKSRDKDRNSTKSDQRAGSVQDEPQDHAERP